MCLKRFSAVLSAHDSMCSMSHKIYDGNSMTAYSEMGNTGNCIVLKGEWSDFPKSVAAHGENDERFNSIQLNAVNSPGLSAFTVREAMNH